MEACIRYALMLNISAFYLYRRSRREGRRSSPRRSRSPRRLVSSRSRSRDRADRSDRNDRNDRGRYASQTTNTTGRASGAVTGSSLFAELSKFKKGREIVLAKERQDSRPGMS